MKTVSSAIPGLVISIVNITIWTVVGFPYWKALGLW